MHVQGAGRAQMTTGNLLVAMFRERDSFAVYLLEKQGVSRFDVINYISHGVSKVDPGSGVVPRARGVEQDGDGGGDEAKLKNPLESFCEDLSARAAAGKIDPLIGRDSELERMVQVLCRRRKNNPLLIGEPGVGKTALAEGLALRIHEKKVPGPLLDNRVFSLDMTAVLAGTRFRGDFEERLKAVVEVLTDDPKAILFIDEIHTIVGAGATSGGTMDAANILKPALSNGELRCIGSTTFKDYRNSFERDRALARRFQRIDVGEPTVAEAIEILKGLRSRYEEHHNVKYTDAALSSAAELSARHINGSHLPDKAIDVMDEAGARARLMPEADRPDQIRPPLIEEVVRQDGADPAQERVDDRSRQAAEPGDRLKRVIYGTGRRHRSDRHGHQAVARRPRQPREADGQLPLRRPHRRRQDRAGQAAGQTMGVEFIRFDMSEYMRSTRCRVSSAPPPGYVGFDQGGLLTDAVNKHPHCVLLLDEIEKAHPDLFNILLQVMDHATLTDNTVARRTSAR